MTIPANSFQEAFDELEKILDENRRILNPTKIQKWFEKYNAVARAALMRASDQTEADKEYPIC